MKEYKFNATEITDSCIKWIKEWFDMNGPGCNAVIGLSGGKDSTIVAALCVKALGPERVIGVSMPDGEQGINDADRIAEYLGIRYKCVNIGKTCDALRMSLGYGIHPKFALSTQSVQNIPPRIRMTVLYAIAQTENGRVSCNCNLSEDYIGYSTLFGDNAGSFAPISQLTVTELIGVGECLGLPKEWVSKVPDDGLPHSLPDEEKFGFTYSELDHYIREGIEPAEEKLVKIKRMHMNNRFKTNIIKVPCFNPDIEFLSIIKG